MSLFLCFSINLWEHNKQLSHLMLMFPISTGSGYYQADITQSETRIKDTSKSIQFKTEKLCKELSTILLSPYMWERVMALRCFIVVPAPSWLLKLLGRIKGLSDQRTQKRVPTEKPAAIKTVCLFCIAMTISDKRSKNMRG